MIKAILFDMDDTLFDYTACCMNSVRNCFAELLPGVYEDSMYETFNRTNRGMWKELEFGEITREEYDRTRWKRILAALGFEYDDPMKFDALYKKNMFNGSILLAGVPELLEGLSGSHRLFVATNGPTRQQYNRLEKAGIRRFFEHCFISDEMGVYKPNREYFERCLDIIGLEPEEILMVGDSLYADIEGAANMGMKTCWVNRTGAVNTEEIHPDCEIRSPAELVQVLS